MTRREMWGCLIPVLLTGFAIFLFKWLPCPEPVQRGCRLGLWAALGQSLLTTLPLVWFWNRKGMLGIWIGGILVRFGVFVGIVIFVFNHPFFHPAATLLTFALSAFLFLLVETTFFFGRSSSASTLKTVGNKWTS